MGARSAIPALAIAAILTGLTVPATAGVAALGLKGGLSAATLHGDLPTDPLFSNGRRFGVAGGLGLVLGSGRVSQKLTISGALNVSTGLDQFRAADVGLAFGPGLELGRGHVRGTLEARYTMGLTPASEAAYSDNARNGALLVMAGLVLRP